jgi:hypothetical protein
MLQREILLLAVFKMMEYRVGRRIKNVRNLVGICFHM